MLAIKSICVSECKGKSAFTVEDTSFVPSEVAITVADAVVAAVDSVLKFGVLKRDAMRC